MTQLAIHWSHENFKTALPYRDQAPYIKKQVWSFSKEKIYKHKEQKQFLKATTSLTMTVLRASFLVANSIAKAKKSFSTGKELILPAAEDICCEILGDVMVQKVACIPLLANTITRQIDEIAEGTEAQLSGLMCHRGMQFRLMSLPMLTTGQQCLFWCDIFFRRMCMRICSVCFCCQPKPQLQNYLSL